MQDTKAKADINLIQFHKITSRHVLVLEADVDERDRRNIKYYKNRRKRIDSYYEKEL